MDDKISLQSLMSGFARASLLALLASGVALAAGLNDNPGPSDGMTISREQEAAIRALHAHAAAIDESVQELGPERSRRFERRDMHAVTESIGTANRSLVRTINMFRSAVHRPVLSASEMASWKKRASGLREKSGGIGNDALRFAVFLHEQLTRTLEEDVQSFFMEQGGDQ